MWRGHNALIATTRQARHRGSRQSAPYFAKLISEQGRAVEHGCSSLEEASPLLIIAGAGSGKTNTLANGVPHLIVWTSHFHCFLGHKCTPPLTDNGERARDGTIEAEVNRLAGTLLIPNEAAVYIVREGLVAQAQGIYGVSEPMLTYRLRISGAHTIHARWMQNTARRVRSGDQ
jgi:hypothetical protein